MKITYSNNNHNSDIRRIFKVSQKVDLFEFLVTPFFSMPASRVPTLYEPIVWKYCVDNVRAYTVSINTCRSRLFVTTLTKTCRPIFPSNSNLKLLMDQILLPAILQFNIRNSDSRYYTQIVCSVSSPLISRFVLFPPFNFRPSKFLCQNAYNRQW